MNSKQNVTIKDIARKAGTSVATAGRALGGYGKVSQKTRDKVLAAAREHNFQPNMFARSLKGKATNTIGLMIANVRVPFFSLLVRAVEDAAIEKGFSVFVCNIDDDREKECNYLSLLRSKRVDGIIVCSAFTSRDEMRGKVAHLYEQEVPTVFLDRRVEGVKRPAVQIDNLNGSVMAVEHLLSLGHERIGLATHEPTIDTIAKRIQGYKQALSNRGIAVDPSLIAVRGLHSLQDGFDTTRALMGRKNRPTALLTINALMTFGALAAIKELGLRIPEDVSLIGWDDFELASVMTPAISVLSQPTYSLGSIATNMLFDMINNRGEPESIVLTPQLVSRDSCARLPRAARA